MENTAQKITEPPDIKYCDLLAACEQSLPLLLAHHRVSGEGATTIRLIEAAIAAARGES